MIARRDVTGGESLVGFLQGGLQVLPRGFKPYPAGLLLLHVSRIHEFVSTKCEGPTSYI